MIERQNWLDTKQFLAHYAKIGRDPETVKRVRGALRHLLEWADDKPLPKARDIDPSFPTFLLTGRNDGKGTTLSAATMKKTCEYSRVFLNWIRSEHGTRYRLITASFVETIRPSLRKGMHSEFHEHKFWELEDVRKIAALAPANLTEERDQAAVCLLFLTAMRAQAFVSLPIKGIDLANKTVNQFPELGVHTKNGKAARTQMLRAPDLMAVVEAWDAKARGAGCILWYPRIDRWHRFAGTESVGNWISRRTCLNKGIRELCQRAGVEYLSAHKLRHGHIVYAMRRVKDMKGLKALSQNAMHSSVAITDGIYGRLVNDDIETTYEEMGN